MQICKAAQSIFGQLKDSSCMRIATSLTSNRQEVEAIGDIWCFIQVPLETAVSFKNGQLRAGRLLKAIC